MHLMTKLLKCVFLVLLFPELFEIPLPKTITITYLPATDKQKGNVECSMLSLLQYKDYHQLYFLQLIDLIGKIKYTYFLGTIYFQICMYYGMAILN